MVKKNQIFISGMIIWLFAVSGTAIVGITEMGTHEMIAENERQALLRNLFELVPADSIDNKLTEDFITIEPSHLLGNVEPMPAYRARKDGLPVAIIFNAIAHDGYSGDIHLLVAIKTDGRISGVRAIKHKETPGLGDGIDAQKSNWIFSFNDKSLNDPTDKKDWKVKRDGGIFDQMTGATITPRAIVNTVYNTLLYYQDHQEILFTENKDG